jgi:Zn-dependent protease
MDREGEAVRRVAQSWARRNEEPAWWAGQSLCYSEVMSNNLDANPDDPRWRRKGEDSSHPPAEPESSQLNGDDAPILAWLAEADAARKSSDGISDPTNEVFAAELVEERPPAEAPWITRPRLRPRPRRRMIPIALFLFTCASTFFAGACAWVPTEYIQASVLTGSLMPIRRVMVAHWSDGLIYMGCVLAILLTHEMGHFIATLRYRIPASFPYFLPLPISPIGTLGAVIGMEGFRANRKEIFDIGIAGPLAGLVVAIPILWIGVWQLDFSQPGYGIYELDSPLLVRWLLDYIQPPGYVAGQGILHGNLNPFFMAGWVGLLVTGLNMMPVSQLDGGHVVYSLLGKRAHWVARGFILLAIGYIFYSGTHAFWLMVVLIMLVGTDHPPTRDDTVKLGWFRTLLGCLSLAIPVLCFAPRVLIVFPP